ncbi:hypothetical protein [Acidomonas methanolica]|uniref:Uncharacterized protein n=1 Tax=Acidomonas methanolica NBRC 104435 TaxID=1231351 RepID=A0A023D692_ACIMT|nr:hypothetical protein [Acidomonas methanolica]MBU2655079.1 hypothetical protein [Acidomonas methanolica]TCS29489.1 hypothetical protein EDC31_10658 [Acidomonas methanolica]GAJ29331.1 hypothetical protein Amme_059_050 [Acidomonas methanolica NBRC 104435]GBQ45535.1 hypothetical protein AA0498_0074 [Acidomonas methanolica]GEK99095.1 hypothetical protein AME01nite_15940 [Acidomonas methanolica NBRC 104435]
METIHIAVACRNASGMADMPVFTVAVSDEEYGLGIHYDKAEAMAEEAGYEKPFVCFDPVEQPAIVSAVRTLDLVPQVVVINITEGLVHSVCCDTGEIKVICYDENDTDDSSDAVDDHPVGENGAAIRCWAHIETADVDPGLKKARDWPPSLS